MAVYRSVITNKSDVINTIIRMGKDGSLVDNAHAGGFVLVLIQMVDLVSIAVTNMVKRTVFNGIDFSNNEYVVPKLWQG